MTDSKIDKLRHKYTLPACFNLLQDESSGIAMTHVSYRQDKNKLQVDSNKNTKVLHHDHPLDLGFVLTVCKVKGLTFDKVIFWLEQSKGRRR